MIEIAVGAPRDQHLVGALDVGPQRHIGALRLQLAADERHAARHALLVQLDARHRIELRRVPVLGKKIQRRAPRNAAELLVVEAKMLGDRAA